MTLPEDFRCGDCGVFPGEGCIYMWPSQSLPPYTITVYRPKSGHRWDRVVVHWNGYGPYTEQVLKMERWIKIGGGEVHWSINSKHPHFSGSFPKQFARVGTPTQRPHTARYRAAYDFELAAYQDAMQEYLREWLRDFGDIFAHC